MNQIDNITNDPNQLVQVILDDGTTVSLNLIYRPAVQRWTIDVQFGTEIYNGINVCIHPNFMREWRNILPFGLSCNTTDGADPVFLDDFSNGRAALFILTHADVELIEETCFGSGVAP